MAKLANECSFPNRKKSSGPVVTFFAVRDHYMPRRSWDWSMSEFVVQPRLAGHGPTLVAGLSKRIDLKIVSRLEFGRGSGDAVYANSVAIGRTRRLALV